MTATSCFIWMPWAFNWMHKTNSCHHILIDSPGFFFQMWIHFTVSFVHDGMDVALEMGLDQSSCVGVKKKSHCIGEFIIVKFGFSLGIDAPLHENNDMSTFVDALQSDHWHSCYQPGKLLLQLINSLRSMMMMPEGDVSWVKSTGWMKPVWVQDQESEGDEQKRNFMEELIKFHGRID